MATCYGTEHVYVLNEIAAHAAGALHHDKRVDTIFEIGGQDAKYIRLAGGRVVDAAMNEACSAGTGSFIEEQGKKFSGHPRRGAPGGRGATDAESGSRSGSTARSSWRRSSTRPSPRRRHRSVVAGIYDSIVQNYLNRVKGSRPVGDVVFCQGMPFARQTPSPRRWHARPRAASSSPPNPGTVGALGIALLTEGASGRPGDPHRPGALPRRRGRARTPSSASRPRGVRRDPGNHCRIDRICDDGGRGAAPALHLGRRLLAVGQGNGQAEAPDLAPDPFREREALVDEIVQRVARRARAARSASR